MDLHIHHEYIHLLGMSGSGFLGSSLLGVSPVWLWGPSDEPQGSRKHGCELWVKLNLHHLEVRRSQP